MDFIKNNNNNNNWYLNYGINLHHIFLLFFTWDIWNVVVREDKLLLCFKYGPKRPIAVVILNSSNAPTSLGNLNSSSASSRVIVSRNCPFLKLAYWGFSSSVASPICTIGPNLAKRAKTFFSVWHVLHHANLKQMWHVQF